MIAQTTESKIAEVIEASIPEIVKLPFRAPSRFDGASVPHYGYWNADRGSCLSFTSKAGYEMTTRDDYIALASAGFDAIGQDGDIKAHWQESKSVAQATIIIQPSRDERLNRYDLGGGDSIWPRLIIRAPFGRPFSVTGGMYRDACRNLDIPRVAGAEFDVSIRHTAQLRDRMDELIQLCRGASDFAAMADRCRELNNVDANVAEVLAKLYPIDNDATDNQKTRHRNRAEQIVQRIMREQLKLRGAMADNGRAPLFQIVSAVTGYVQHDKTRKNGVGEVERAVMGLSDPESVNAWRYAGSALAS